MTASKTASAKVQSLQRQAQAIELRRAGLGFAEIASRLGIGKSQAHRYVVAGMQEARDQINAQADELRAEEVSRLDAMLSGLWPAARKGGVAAVDRVVKIMERRAKLLGLDAPVKLAHGGDGSAPPIQHVSMTPDEFRAIAADIAGRV